MYQSDRFKKMTSIIEEGAERSIEDCSNIMKKLTISWNRLNRFTSPM